MHNPPLIKAGSPVVWATSIQETITSVLSLIPRHHFGPLRRRYRLSVNVQL
jgi:hypothetical protein